MRVLMVCAEYAPFAKTGGLADMVAGLCRALAAAGHDVRVLLPAYRGLDSGDSRSSIAAAIGLGELQVSPVSLNDTHPAYQFRGPSSLPAGCAATGVETEAAATSGRMQWPRIRKRVIFI